MSKEQDSREIETITEADDIIEVSETVIDQITTPEIEHEPATPLAEASTDPPKLKRIPQCGNCLRFGVKESPIMPSGRCSSCDK
jgi:hypothetical protein